MNWVQRKIYLYNVTFGLYMLDWWERYLFNILVVVLMWFIFYNSSRYVADFCQRHVVNDREEAGRNQQFLFSSSVLHNAQGDDFMLKQRPVDHGLN